MSNLVRNEIEKIFARKKIYFFLLIIFFIVLVPAFFMKFTDIGEKMNINSQSFVIQNLISNMDMLFPILITILIADIFTEEYSKGTLKLPLLHPVSRKNLINAKLIGLSISSLILLLFSLLVSLGIGTVFFNWQEYFSIGNITIANISGILLTVLLYVSSIIPLIIFAMIITCMALRMESSGAVVGSSIGLLFIMKILSQLSSTLSPYLITHYFDLSRLIGNSQGVKETLFSIIIMLIYGVLSYTIAVRYFAKKDILH